MGSQTGGMRLFFAVDLPEDLKAEVGKLQTSLSRRMADPTIRWVRPALFHYTLKFLGDLNQARAQAAIEAVEPVCKAAAPFTLRLAGLGAFPSPSRPSVVWIGASEGADDFTSLAQTIDQALARVRFRMESRPPTAHLTLARIKTYAAEVSVSAGLQRIEIGEIGAFRVERIVLMRSVLSPAGPDYTAVEAFALRGTAAEQRPGGDIMDGQ